MTRPTQDELQTAREAFGVEACKFGILPWADWCRGTTPEDVVEAIALSQRANVAMPVRWVGERLRCLRREHQQAARQARSVIDSLEVTA